MNWTQLLSISSNSKSLWTKDVSVRCRLSIIYWLFIILTTRIARFTISRSKITQDLWFLITWTLKHQSLRKMHSWVMLCSLKNWKILMSSKVLVEANHKVKAKKWKMPVVNLSKERNSFIWVHQTQARINLLTKLKRLRVRKIKALALLKIYRVDLIFIMSSMLYLWTLCLWLILKTLLHYLWSFHFTITLNILWFKRVLFYRC